MLFNLNENFQQNSFGNAEFTYLKIICIFFRLKAYTVLTFWAEKSIILE